MVAHGAHRGGEGGHLVFFGGCLSDFCVRIVAEHTEGMGLQYRADTFQIIRGKDRAKGVIVHENFMGLNDDMTFMAIMKEAVYGGTDAQYYLLDTCITDDFRLDGKNAVSIKCSDFLWDEKYPLHYSLQNAFDGDPVENTEDDLFDIDFQGLRQVAVVGLAVINGYASNENLYYSNNRMADFQYNSKSKTGYINNLKLRDHTIDYQKFESCFPNAPTSIASGVTEIYKGSKYNDTCIAELNFICSDGSYLFGDIDE